MASMTNDALKAVLEKYSDQVFYITLGENLRIFLNVDAGNPEMVCTTDQIQFENFAGTDCFGIPHPNHNSWGNKVPYTRWYVTEQIHSFGVCDDPTNMNLPDLAAIR